MIIKINKSQPGQALIEAIMAFGIAVLALVALVQLANKSVSNSGQSSRQAVATNLATEAMQWVKSQRVTMGWQDGFAGRCGNVMPCSQSYCLNTLEWINTGTCTGVITGTEFDRNLQLTGETVGAVNPVDQITATVTVSWNESGRTVTARQEFVFANR